MHEIALSFGANGTGPKSCVQDCKDRRYISGGLRTTIARVDIPYLVKSCTAWSWLGTLLNPLPLFASKLESRGFAETYTNKKACDLVRRDATRQPEPLSSPSSCQTTIQMLTMPLLFP